jgi:hypothetical protein
MTGWYEDVRPVFDSPTATHVAPWQETSFRAKPRPPAGGVTTDHEAPFQSAIMFAVPDPVPAPTATHEIAEVHETPTRNWPGAVPGAIDQVNPFHSTTDASETSPLLAALPTPRQKVALVHETLRRPDPRLLKFPSVGEESFQVVPFHISMTADGPPPQTPTAAQNVVLVHDTEVKFVATPGPTFGAATTDQTEPFHFSVRADVSPIEPPTAIQNLGLRQSTPSKFWGTEELGVAITDHVVPFHDSMSGAALSSTTGTNEPGSDPTATQKVELAQETADSSFGAVATAGEVDTVHSFASTGFAAAPGNAARVENPSRARRKAKAAATRPCRILWGLSCHSIHRLKSKSS